jgi:hypothetical protein
VFGRWATTLTETARSAAKAAREAEIIRLREEGKTIREVAQATGDSYGTVQSTISQRNDDQKRQSSDSGSRSAPEPQPDPGFEVFEPSLREVQIERAKEELRELASPPAKNWSSALRALRHINEQIPVEELFAERYDGFDRALWPELEAAYAWINEFWEVHQ